MEVLLFGGTTEGRELAEWLARRGGLVTLCVATDYGARLVPADKSVSVRTGRLDGVEMASLMKSRPYTCVVDATHPYANLATATIRAAAEKSGRPYYRLIREGAPEGEGWVHASTPAEAAERLKALPGNVLLTTGSKDLNLFADLDLLGRVYPRVLPSLDSLARCLDLGFPPAHVLCLQGPFSKKLNVALMEQYEIKTLVTKASGGAGGFWEKAEAAKDCGATLLVIDRPSKEEGMSYNAMTVFLETLRQGAEG